MPNRTFDELPHGHAVIIVGGGPVGLADHTNTFFDHYGIGKDGAVLVRPDGYVAWRSPTGPDHDTPLVRVLEEILDRRP